MVDNRMRAVVTAVVTFSPVVATPDLYIWPSCVQQSLVSLNIMDHPGVSLASYNTIT